MLSVTRPCRPFEALALALALAGCAEADLGQRDIEPDAQFVPGPTMPDGSPPATDARPDAPDADEPDGGGSDPRARVCPAGQFATGFDATGDVECAPIDATAKATFEDHCDVYAGWINSCDGCSGPPIKWGRAGGGQRCEVGTGVDNNCAAPTLGGVGVALFGLNADGDVTGADKYFVGFRCESPADPPRAGPCAPGNFLTSLASGGQCVTGRAAIGAYLRASCQLYYGWRNNCEGCLEPPEEWGVVGTATCTVGAGEDGTCSQALLGANSVPLYGLNPEGDVGENDTFFVGLRCSGATGVEVTVLEGCPEGLLVIGRDEAGQVMCASPALATEATVAASCSVYQGIRDRCSGCAEPPSKWGRTSQQACADGAGLDNTCTQPVLGGTAVRMFGLNTDGDVNGDDQYYFGTRCL